MSYSIRTACIRETLDIDGVPTGTVYISWNMDALPAHYQSDEFDGVDAAKASAPGADWQEPDEDCDGDVLAFHVEPA